MSKETRAFAQLLRDWRKTVGLTQDQAAKRFGLSRRTIIRLENAQGNRVSWDTRDKILSAIQGDPDAGEEGEASSASEGN